MNEDNKLLFKYNTDVNGGAIAFYEKSFIISAHNPGSYITTSEFCKFYAIQMHNNRAQEEGGGIFIKDSDYFAYAEYSGLLLKPLDLNFIDFIVIARGLQ